MHESKYVDCLMNRFIYLNELRVGVAKVYFAVVAALLAVLTIKTPHQETRLGQALKFSIFPLFIIEVLVFIFDLRCRARASAAARAIRLRVKAPKNYAISSKVPLRKRIDEDFCFSMIVMIINAILVFPSLTLISQYYDISDKISWWILAICAAIVFLIQAIIYIYYCPKLARAMDEWPDDPLFESSPKKEDDQGIS